MSLATKYPRQAAEAERAGLESAALKEQVPSSLLLSSLELSDTTVYEP